MIDDYPVTHSSANAEAIWDVGSGEIFIDSIGFITLLFFKLKFCVKEAISKLQMI